MGHFLSYKTSYFPNGNTVKMSNDCLHENLKINHVKSIHVASQLTTPENTITYHNALCLSPKNFSISIAFSFSWELKWPQEELKTMLMQNFGVTNEEHYGML